MAQDLTAGPNVVTPNGAASLEPRRDLAAPIEQRPDLAAPPEPRRDRIVPLIVLAASALLYGLTSARSPGWVDATLIMNSARNLEIGARALTHNLFNLLGHVWLMATPFLDPHRSLTLLCALLGSLTVMLLYRATREATGSRAAAALTSVAMALSQSLWWHSAMIEVYTLNTVLIAAMLCFVFGFRRQGGFRRLYAAAFCLGLGISNHLLMGLYVFGFAALAAALLARRRIRIFQAALMMLCALAGASPFIFAFARDCFSYGVPAVLNGMRGGEYAGKMFPAGMSAAQRLFWALNYVFLIFWNFPSAALIFAAIGIPKLFKADKDKSAALFFFLGLAAQAVWSANYLIWDMYAFSLPVYVMLSVPIAFGIDGFLKKTGPGRARLRWAVFITFLFPLALYPGFSHWPGREATIDRYISMYPESERLGGYWDPAEYIFNPIKSGYRVVEDFAAAWAERLPPGACYWDDESKAAMPLDFYYQRVRGMRPDVQLHRFFGLFLSDEGASALARDMELHLSRGDPVFISSLAVPEREIVNKLVRIFPRLKIEEIKLGGQLPSMYRLSP